MVNLPCSVSFTSLPLFLLAPDDEEPPPPPPPPPVEGFLAIFEMVQVKIRVKK